MESAFGPPDVWAVSFFCGAMVDKKSPYHSKLGSETRKTKLKRIDKIVFVFLQISSGPELSSRTRKFHRRLRLHFTITSGQA